MPGRDPLDSPSAPVDNDTGGPPWLRPLGGDDLAVMRRLAARLTDDDRSSRPGRTLRSILVQLLGMDQAGLEAVVSLYNTSTPRGPRTQQVDPFIAGMSYSVMSPRAKGLSLVEGTRPPASGRARSRDARAGGPASPDHPGQRAPVTSAVLSSRAASLWVPVLGHARGSTPAIPPPGEAAQHSPELRAPEWERVDPPALADRPPGDDTGSGATLGASPSAAAPAADGRPDTAADAVEPGSAALSGPVTARYCGVCLLWLNGPKQLAGHQIGRDHRRWEAVGGKHGPLPLGAPARDGAGALAPGDAAGPALPEPGADAGAPEGRQYQ